MGQKDTKGEKKGNNENEKNTTSTSTRRTKNAPPNRHFYNILIYR
jgi:hypothetical protein